MPPSLADNLNRLENQLHAAALAAELPQPVPPMCVDMARALPLTHAVPSETFTNIAADTLNAGWKLLSPAKLALHSQRPLPTDSPEVALDTSEAVFLFCGQFRYPNTQAGFLFLTSLEADRSNDSEASPFDSGALHRHVTGPDVTEPPRDFLARHTLPVPSYRNHLAQRLHYLFAAPQHYVTRDVPPLRPDPIGLRPKPPAMAMDPRQWTFEIRVRNEVPLASPHLGAVFYSPRLGQTRAARQFLAALRQQNIQLKALRPQADGDFKALQRHCVDYLRSGAIL